MASCYDNFIATAQWQQFHDATGTDRNRWLSQQMQLTADVGSQQHGIEVELYNAALSHGLSLGLSEQQLNSLLGITQQVHRQAVTRRLPMDVAFQLCGDLFMTHSIERPPKSSAIFSLRDMQELLKYLQDTYFLNYALYQYAFTPEVLLDFEATDPAVLVERPAQLPPLCQAATESEWAKQVAEQKQAAEQQEAERQMQGAAAAESAREQAVRAAYVAAIPDEIKAQVDAAVQREVGLLRKQVQQDYLAQAARLRDQIDALKV